MDPIFQLALSLYRRVGDYVRNPKRLSLFPLLCGELLGDCRRPRSILYGPGAAAIPAYLGFGQAELQRSNPQARPLGFHGHIVGFLVCQLVSSPQARGSGSRVCRSRFFRHHLAPGHYRRLAGLFQHPHRLAPANHAHRGHQAGREIRNCTWPNPGICLADDSGSGRDDGAESRVCGPGRCAGSKRRKLQSPHPGFWGIKGPEHQGWKTPGSR